MGSEACVWLDVDSTILNSVVYTTYLLYFFCYIAMLYMDRKTKIDEPLFVTRMLGKGKQNDQSWYDGL